MPNCASRDETVRMTADTPETATLAESHTEMTEILLPNDTNALGRALGGVVLHWMDICGAIAASRFANRWCVTASMDHVDFMSPIELGEIAIIEGYVYNAGRTSLDVRVDVRAENPREDGTRRTTTSYLTYVAVDDEGSPIPVPDLVCEDDASEDLRETALEQQRANIESLVDRLE